MMVVRMVVGLVVSLEKWCGFVVSTAGLGFLRRCRGR